MMIKILSTLAFYFSLSYSFSQETYTKYNLSNPLPRVGESVRIEFDLTDYASYITEKIIGNYEKFQTHPIFGKIYRGSYSSLFYELNHKFEKQGWNELPFLNLDFTNKSVYVDAVNFYVDKELDFSRDTICFRYRKFQGKYYCVLEQVLPYWKCLEEITVDTNELLGPVPQGFDNSKFVKLKMSSDDYILKQRDSYSKAVGDDKAYHVEVFELKFLKDSFLLDETRLLRLPENVNFSTILIAKPPSVKFKPYFDFGCEKWRDSGFNIQEKISHNKVSPDSNGYYFIDVGVEYKVDFFDPAYENFKYYYDSIYFHGIYLDEKKEDTIEIVYYPIKSATWSEKDRKYIFRNCDEKPLNGYHEFFSSANSLMQKGRFKNGKPVDSLFFYYFGSQSPSFIQVFKNGKAKRLIKYHRNGKLKSIYNIGSSYYSRGLEEMYYDTGVPVFETKKGEKTINYYEKVSTVYFSNGNKMYDIRNDSLFHYSENGKLIYNMVNVSNEVAYGKMNIYKFYNPEGEIISLIKLRDYSLRNKKRKKEFELVDLDSRYKRYDRNLELIIDYENQIKYEFKYPEDDNCFKKIMEKFVLKDGKWISVEIRDENIGEDALRLLKMYFPH